MVVFTDSITKEALRIVAGVNSLVMVISLAFLFMFFSDKSLYMTRDELSEAIEKLNQKAKAYGHALQQIHDIFLSFGQKTVNAMEYGDKKEKDKKTVKMKPK